MDGFALLKQQSCAGRALHAPYGNEAPITRGVCDWLQGCEVNRGRSSEPSETRSTDLWH